MIINHRQSNVVKTSNEAITSAVPHLQTFSIETAFSDLNVNSQISYANTVFLNNIMYLRPITQSDIIKCLAELVKNMNLKATIREKLYT